MILSFLFYAFLAYLIYKLVFGLIIPLVRTTRQVKRGFREMNERMRQHTEGFGQQRPHVQEAPKKGPSQQGDYIEFEEVKD